MVTIEEIISRVDNVRQNPFGKTQKIAWLSLLDGVIYRELISQTEGCNATFSHYTDVHQELLVDKPFDEMYILYLFAQIDFYLGETIKYDSDITVFQDYYDNYSNDYINSHKMIKPPKILW